MKGMKQQLELDMKQQSELDMEQQTGSKLRKQYSRMAYCILPPCLFNSYAENIMQNAGLDESQAGITTTGRNINNLRCYHSNGRKQRETEDPLDEAERGEWEKTGLKSNIQETKITASDHITS